MSHWVTRPRYTFAGMNDNWSNFIIRPDDLAQGMEYPAYRALMDQEIRHHEEAGTLETDSLAGYTKLNRERMQRVEKTVQIVPETQTAMTNLTRDLIWVVLSEPWCGDAAQNLPVMQAMASLSPHVRLIILLRDTFPEIMDQYLTNDGKAIPKLICLDAETGYELFNWGPRPAPAQELLYAWKKSPETPKDEFYKQVQLWYAKDHGRTVQAELVSLLQKAYAIQP